MRVLGFGRMRMRREFGVALLWHEIPSCARGHKGASLHPAAGRLDLLSCQSKAVRCSDCDKESAMTMVTGLFKDKDSAELAFQSVVDLGYDKSDVNVVMSDDVRRRLLLAHKPSTDPPGTTDLEQAAAAHANSSADQTWGGPVGGTVGTLAPVVAAVGVLLIPGFGIAAGPVAIALAASAATGVAIGLMATLMNWGIPDSRVKQYEAGVRAGGILLGVKARSDADALQIHQRWQQAGAEHVHR